MKLHLIGLNEQTLHFAVHQLPALVGRSAAAAIRLWDQSISRVHCEISNLDGTLLVRDLGSRHGTYVNGVRVTEGHLLPGDRLTVGKMRLRIHYERPPRRRTRHAG